MKSKAIGRFKTALAIVAGATAINVAAQHLPKERERITNIVYMDELDDGQKAEIKALMESRGNVCDLVQFYDRGEVKEALHCNQTP